MKRVGENTIVIVGEEFDKNLPVRGTVIYEFPDGSEKKFDVLDIVDVEWYEDVI